MDQRLYENGAPSVSGIDESIINSVSVAEPWTVVERFAGLERVSGTDDERESAAYLTDRLDSFGVDHEMFEPELYLSTPHGAEIETDNGWRSETVKTVSFSGSGTAEGDLIYIYRERR